MRRLFIATIFVNAALLFSVQPMFARDLLPLLGGVPAVWNTALVFFQTALLAGYAYAWALSARLPLAVQVPVHLAVMAVPLAVLPVAVPAGWAPAAGASPVAWQLGLMAATVGLPFFALATNATLLQHWFSKSRHRDAADPYFLYGASNAGSVAALLAYPAVVAPLMGLATQGRAWSAGYAALLALLAAAGVGAWRNRAAAAPATAAPAAATAAAAANPGPAAGAWRRRLAWAALAFVPSSLLLGVTLHVSSEVTVAPLLWVVPLAIYLATFVNAFARRPWISRRVAVAAQTATAILLAVTFFMKIAAIWLVFAVHLAAFGCAGLVCHGELAARRPPPARLPEFYLWLALGGALGGAFNALVAPLLFSSVVEYPVAVVLACALRPTLTATDDAWARLKDVLYPGLLALALVAVALRIAQAGWTLGVAALAFAAAACVVMRARPVRFALSIAAVLVFGAVATWGTTDVVARERTFFGVHKVIYDAGRDAYRLIHGVTVHGTQFAAPALRTTPTGYYYEDGPLGQLFDFLGRSGPPRRVALVGLGAGASLCYRRPGDAWRVYEIDPAVERLARDTRFFHFVAGCGGATPVTLGDARLSLARPGAGPFDLIILDAFTSDAIPAHLLTREAMALYRRLLAPEGLIAVHVTNKFMDLAPVVAASASAAGMSAVVQYHEPRAMMAAAGIGKRSRWVVVGPDHARVAALADAGRWRRLEATARPWTDDYWNILAAIRWQGIKPGGGR